MVMHQGPQLFTRMGLDLQPPVDDRPFFFQAARLFHLDAETTKALTSDVNIQSISILRLTLGIVGVVTLVLFFLPFAIFKSPECGPGFWAASGYFGLIGVGFMLLELPWIQQSILFLGHPSYATSVVLSSLLLGAGLGSAIASRTPLIDARRMLLYLPLVAAAVSLALAPLFQIALAYPLAIRAIIAAIVFVSVGVFMGFALPLGFLTFGDRHKSWWWAINGGCGVLASALSIALAITFGFLATSLIGVGC
jgi:hypothetical protein